MTPANTASLLSNCVFARVAPHVMVHPRAGKDAVIVGEDRAAFAGIEILELIEAEGPGLSDGADTTPLVGKAHGLTSILDDFQSMLLGDRSDGVHIANKVQHMDRYDCLGIWRDFSFDILGIDGQTFIDVDEYRNSTHRQRRYGRGDPRVGRHQYFVARDRCPAAASAEISALVPLLTVSACLTPSFLVRSISNLVVKPCSPPR